MERSFDLLGTLPAAEQEKIVVISGLQRHNQQPQSKPLDKLSRWLRDLIRRGPPRPPEDRQR